MADDKIVKIYDVSLLGSDKALQELNKINKQFIEIKKNKLALSGTRVSVEDPAELQKIEKELNDLILAEKRLATELKKKQVEMKELQLLNAKEREEAKKTKQGIDALEGSYNAINKRYRELLTISKNSTNLFNPDEVREAQTELKKYKDLLDNFNRGLTKDGTLVGEYTTGILQAFKQGGLDDIINNQINSAKDNVAQLDKEFAELKQRLQEVQNTGTGSLDTIERQLLENRQAAAGFTEQINRVENELRNMNSTGSSIASSIGLQFRNMRNQVAGFVLGFAGFQALLSKGQSFVGGSIEEAQQADTALARLESRLKNLGRIKELEPLTRTVEELAKQFSYLDNDDLTNATEQLVTYGKVSEAQIRQLLPLIIDFAANSRVSLQEATSVIIKGLEGNGKALKEYGIDIKDAANETEAFALITQVLGAKVKGAAQTFADTQSGALAKQQQALRDQQELLGQRLLPLYIKLTSAGVALASVLASFPFGPLVAALGVAAAAWIYYKTATIAAFIATQAATEGTLAFRAVALLEAAAIAVSNGYKTAAATITAIYTAAQIRLATATGATAVVTRALSAALAFLASPVGIAIGVIAALVTVLGVMSAKAEQSQGYIDRFNQKMRESAALNRVNAEATERANKSTSDTIALLKTKVAIAKNENLTIETRKRAMEDVVAVDREYFKGLTLQNIATQQGIDLVQKYIDKIYQKAKAEAYAQLITEKQKALIEAQGREDQIKIKYGREVPGGFEVRNTQTFGNFLLNKATFGAIGAEGNGVQQLQDVRKEIQGLTDDLDALQNMAANNKDIQAALLSQGGTTGGVPTVNTTGGNSPDKKVDRIAKLKKDYDDEKAVLEEKFNERKISEAEYYQELIKLANTYRNVRIDQITKLSEEELSSKKQLRSDLAKDKADAIQKEFEMEAKLIEDIKDREEAAIRDRIQANEDNLGISDLEKATNKSKLDQELLNLQLEYNASMDLLEKKFNLQSATNEEERAKALLELQRALAKDLQNQQIEAFRNLQAEQVQQIREIQAGISAEALAVLQDGNLSPKQKEKKLKGIEKSGADKIGGARLTQIDDELAENKALLDQKLINQAEFNTRVSELEEERLEILKSANDRELNAEKEKQDLKQTMYQAAFQIAESFINAYIEAQQQEVEAVFNATKERLAIEKDERLARAQSKAEEQAIENEFKAKEDEAERKRNKARQNIARQQLAIEFAVASLKALSTSTNIYEGLAKVAVVAAEYIASLALLNAQKFAGGGLVRPEKLPNGMITATPNTPALSNGDNVLAYVKPGEVILNKEQQAALGGASTFASIGVPGFGGASVRPPIFQQYYQNTGGSSGGNSASLDELAALVYNLAGIVYHEAAKPVLLDADALRKANAEKARNVSLADV